MIKLECNGPTDTASLRDAKTNKAVYTTTDVAGRWAGAVMPWAGAKMSKMQKKQSVTDGRTDGRTDKVTYRSS